MTVGRLLEELRSRDIKVWADGEHLRCSAPTGLLTAEVRTELQQRKNEILEFLRSAQALAQQPRAIVPLQPRGTRAPIFAVPGHNGDVFCYREMVRYLGDDQPFFGLQPPGVDGQAPPLTSVEGLGAYFASQIRAVHSAGACVVAGYCAGGTIAFELARQLAGAGIEIRFVALFGTPYPGWYRFLPQFRYRLGQRAAWVRTHIHALLSLPSAERVRYFAGKLRSRKAQRRLNRVAPQDPVLALRANVEAATIAAIRRYRPRPFHGRLELFLPNRQWLRFRTELLRWRTMASESDVRCGPDGCPGDQMLLEPYVSANTELFRVCCDKREVEAVRPVDQSASVALTDSRTSGSATIRFTTS